MEPELFDFMRHVRPRIAAGTWNRKLWQLQSFFKYLANKRKNAADVTRTDVETYLSGLSQSKTQYSNEMCVYHGYYKSTVALNADIQVGTTIGHTELAATDKWKPFQIYFDMTDITVGDETTILVEMNGQNGEAAEFYIDDIKACSVN